MTNKIGLYYVCLDSPVISWTTNKRATRQTNLQTILSNVGYCRRNQNVKDLLQHWSDPSDNTDLYTLNELVCFSSGRRRFVGIFAGTFSRSRNSVHSDQLWFIWANVCIILDVMMSEHGKGFWYDGILRILGIWSSISATTISWTIFVNEKKNIISWGIVWELEECL